MGFTFEAYRQYVSALRSAYTRILRFDEYLAMGEPKPESFCLIRHDVDRRPGRALAMARLERDMDVRASYYFRAKPGTFREDIIRSIADLGHEIGYHYECLSDTGGDVDAALKVFAGHLRRFRELTPVRTISMHGRPLLPHDNRDLWRDAERHRLLRDEFDILGELYLDIDYTDIAYVNDTGRNWTAGVANRRDHVNTRVNASFATSQALREYLGGEPHPRLVFQIHPERWTRAAVPWVMQWATDQSINVGKRILARGRASVDVDHDHDARG